MTQKMDVIVFGNVPLTTWVVKNLLHSKFMNLVGVVCEYYPQETFVHHGLNEPLTFEYCKQNNLKMLSFEEAGEQAKQKNILGLSVRYYRLFKEEYINAFRFGILNFHGGELPRFRGINIANHVILESAEMCAGTIHFIDKGIDTGDIVCRSYTKITPEDTAHSCFIKTQDCLKQCFVELLETYNSTREIPRKPQKNYIVDGESSKTYYKKDLEGKKIISTDDFKDNTFDIKVRAFTFPGHEPAYLLINNIKYFITK